MSPLRLWMRRGAGVLVPVTLGPLLLLTLGSSQGWFLDADWGLRSAGVVVGFYTPVLAAMAAYDATTRVQPTLAMVGRSGSRGWGVTLLPPGAAFVWAAVAMAAAWAVVVAVVVVSRGIAPADWWVVLETLFAFAAALAVGSWIGNHAGGVLAPALAAVVVIAATLLKFLGVTAFQVVSSSGPMVGIERTPSRALVTIGVNASIVVLFLGLELSGNRGRRRPPVVALVALALPLVITLGLSVDREAEEYRPTQEASVCVGSDPVVCGPARAQRLLTVAQRDLADATVALGRSGLPLPDAFMVARGESVRELGPDRAELPVQLASLGRGHLSRSVVLDALSQPHVCAALFEAPTAEEYLNLAAGVRAWMDQQLSLPAGASGPAPGAVLDAYHRLDSCTIAAPRA